MSHETQILLATVAALLAIGYAWRRWGFFGALVAAVAISALAGTYVPAIHDAVISVAEAFRSAPDLVIRLAE